MGKRMRSGIDLVQDRIIRRRVVIVTAILVAALVARMAVIVWLPNSHHPDEIFQSIEQAHRFVFGYGVVPWEFRDGARSPLLPWALSAVIWPVSLVADGSWPYLIAIGVVLSLLSLLSVVGAMRIGWRLSPLHGVFAGVATAVWFELVHFAGKPLTEAVANAFLIFGLSLLPVRDGPPQWRALVLAGAVLGLAVVFRFHLAPALAVGVIWYARYDFRDRWLPLIYGGLIPVALAGAADWVFWGVPFYSYYTNFTVNVIDGRASIYGTSTVFLYFGIFVENWGGAVAVLLALIAFGMRRLPLLLAVGLTILLTHSLVPHKEYRFILSSATLGVILAAVGTVELICGWSARWTSAKRVTQMIGVAIAMWILTSIALGVSPPYRGFWANDREWLLAAQEVWTKPDLCGVALYDISWIQTGGFAWLHRDVPLYPLHDAVEPGLEEGQQVGAGDTAHALGLFEGTAHLLLEDCVVGADALLIEQLRAIHRHLAAHVLAMLAGREGALERGAFWAAPDARAEPAAKLVAWSTVSRHNLLSFRMG